MSNQRTIQNDKNTAFQKIYQLQQRLFTSNHIKPSYLFFQQLFIPPQLHTLYVIRILSPIIPSKLFKINLYFLKCYLKCYFYENYFTIF